MSPRNDLFISWNFFLIFSLLCVRVCSLKQSSSYSGKKDDERNPILNLNDLSSLSEKEIREKIFVHTDGQHQNVDLNDFIMTPTHFRNINIPFSRLRQELTYYEKNNKSWSERVVLESFLFAFGINPDNAPQGTHWFDDGIHVCRWTGVICGEGTLTYQIDRTNGRRKKKDRKVTETSDEVKGNYENLHVTKIDLPNFSLSGTLVSELSDLKDLIQLNLNDNKISGPIPTSFGQFSKMHVLDMGNNLLTGAIPTQLTNLTNLNELWLERNSFIGTIPPQLFTKVKNLSSIDLSWNMLVGTISPNLGQHDHILRISLGGNMFTGPIPSTLGACQSLRSLDLSSNQLRESIPTELGKLKNLVELQLSYNQIYGVIPSQILRLSKLQTLSLHSNQITGTIPHLSWRGMTSLDTVSLQNNNLRGSLPSSISRIPEIRHLDLHMNDLTGKIPEQLGNMKDLVFLDLSSNRLTGKIPQEIGDLRLLSSLNITNNRLTGTIPNPLCKNLSLNNGQTEHFGCYAIACPTGTFSPSGAASTNGGCRTCYDHPDIGGGVEKKKKLYIGTTKCGRTEAMDPDIDGDGKISQREVLRLLYFSTVGKSWDVDPSSSWHKWKDMRINKCSLRGITCRNDDVVKIELQNAKLCDEKNVKCFGIPSELGLLKSLEHLNLSNNRGFKHSIPTSILTLPNLTVLDLSASGLTGVIPSEIGMLEKLEMLNLSLNVLVGTLPRTIGNLTNLREILISRSLISGTIPGSIGNLKALENLELYGNRLTGEIPSSIVNCTSLRRIDLFNNKINGTIPSILSKLSLLQIAHLKANSLTGSIPSQLGMLPVLSWLDLSTNEIDGIVPASLGNIITLKDLRLGGNKLQSPVPESLCLNEHVNSGNTVSFGCDAIACPIGMFSKDGLSNEDEQCTDCKSGETTFYIGGTKCQKFSQRDFLTILYDALKGDEWGERFNQDWKDERISECDWAGVSCDEHGDIDGLTFPLKAGIL